MIPGFVVYKMFCAIKNHFTQDSYDYVKYHGKVNAKVETFLKRKDKFFFEKLGRNISSEEELRDYIIGNLTHGANGLQINPEKIWIGDLTTSISKNRALDFMAKKQALDYFIKKDLTSIQEYIKLKNNNRASSSSHPLLLSLYFDGTILPETIIVLNKVFGGNLFRQWSENQLKNDPIWTKTRKFLEKYERITFGMENGGVIDVQKYKTMYKQIETTNTI